MQLLKTSFALRSDLRWSEDVYEKCIYAWILESENRKNHKKNYADLLKKLPPKINFDKVPEKKFSSVNERLDYSAFAIDGIEYLAFFFAYKNDNRQWEVQAAFKRTKKNVLCFVSLSCELDKGQTLPKISKPRLLDKLLRFQEGATEISKKAHIIPNSNINEAVAILKNGPSNDDLLPIVYFSCSEGTHTREPSVLAEKLFGVARVYAEEDCHIYDRLKLELDGEDFPCRGEIGILYPGQPIQILNRYSNPERKTLPESLVQEIFFVILKRSLSVKFSFSMVELLKAREKFRSLNEQLAKNKSESKKSESIERVRQKIRNLIEENKRLKSENENLRIENKSIKDERKTLEAISIEQEQKLNDELQKLNDELDLARRQLHDAKSTCESLREDIKAAKKKNLFLPLSRPDEEEFFPDEMLCHLVCWLKMAQERVQTSRNSPKSRSKYLLEEILKANSNAIQTYELWNKKMEKLEKTAENQELYKSESLLNSFGMECVPKQNGHSKIRFAEDVEERFQCTEASTPGDSRRGGKNQANELVKAMLWKRA